jgi:hypothetical protein
MIFIDNKYTRWYYSIINAAKARTLTGYIERHHIIPRSLGGDNSKNNLVDLTAREHLICHLLLVRMTTEESRKKMLAAAWAMSTLKNQYHKGRSLKTGRVYENLREEWNKSRYGHRHTEEAKQNMRKPKSEEHRKNISLCQLGKRRKPQSEDTKRKISEAMKGKPKSEETKRKMAQRFLKG